MLLTCVTRLYIIRAGSLHSLVECQLLGVAVAGIAGGVEDATTVNVAVNARVALYEMVTDPVPVVVTGTMKPVEFCMGLN